MTSPNKDNNTQNLQNENQTLVEIPFNGYTIDEIRYQRALLALKADFCKEKIIVNYNEIVGRYAIGKNNTGLLNKGIFKSEIIAKMFKNLNYLDYIFVGFTAFKTIRSVFSIFRRKK